MTFYQGLATVLLRVWAAVFLIQGVTYVLLLVSMALDGAIIWGEGNSGAISISQLVQFTIYFGVGLSLWFSARFLGRRIGNGLSAPTQEVGIDSERLVQVGAFLIGVYFITEYGPRAVLDTAENFIRVARETDAERLTGRVRRVTAWREILEIWAIVGTALVIALSARDIGRLFSWLRTAGQYEEKPAPEKSVPGE